MPSTPSLSHFQLSLFSHLVTLGCVGSIGLSSHTTVPAAAAAASAAAAGGSADGGAAASVDDHHHQPFSGELSLDRPQSSLSAATSDAVRSAVSMTIAATVSADTPQAQIEVASLEDGRPSVESPDSMLQSDSPVTAAATSASAAAASAAGAATAAGAGTSTSIGATAAGADPGSTLAQPPFLASQGEDATASSIAQHDGTLQPQLTTDISGSSGNSSLNSSSGTAAAPLQQPQLSLPPPLSRALPCRILDAPRAPPSDALAAHLTRLFATPSPPPVRTLGLGLGHSPLPVRALIHPDAALRYVLTHADGEASREHGDSGAPSGSAASSSTGPATSLQRRHASSSAPASLGYGESLLLHIECPSVDSLSRIVRVCLAAVEGARLRGTRVKSFRWRRAVDEVERGVVRFIAEGASARAVKHTGDAARALVFCAAAQGALHTGLLEDLAKSLKIASSAASAAAAAGSIASATAAAAAAPSRLTRQRLAVSAWATRHSIPPLCVSIVNALIVSGGLSPPHAHHQSSKATAAAAAHHGGRTASRRQQGQAQLQQQQGQSIVGDKGGATGVVNDGSAGAAEAVALDAPIVAPPTSTSAAAGGPSMRYGGGSSGGGGGGSSSLLSSSRGTLDAEGEFSDDDEGTDCDDDEGGSGSDSDEDAAVTVSFDSDDEDSFSGMGTGLNDDDDVASKRGRKSVGSAGPSNFNLGPHAPHSSNFNLRGCGSGGLRLLSHLLLLASEARNRMVKALKDSGVVSRLAAC